ncbi:MAG: BTAD domain-containing putative transcriptional regulator [Clostridia bacterium]
MANQSVQIKLLGGFEVIVSGKVMLPRLQQSKKTRQLLEYLILKQGKSATHEELLANIWIDRNSINPATALRTLLHRYRCMVDESGITALENSVITSRGGYCWNTNLSCEIDVLEMERLTKEADWTKDTAKKQDLLSRAVDMYTGPLLPASEGENWVVGKAAYYRDIYLGSLYNLVDMLKAQQDYSRIVQICRKALDVEPLDERINAELMVALSQTGRGEDAFLQYQHHGVIGRERQGESARTEYERLMRAGERTETDIDKIQQYLLSGQRLSGAYVCDYAVFAEIFELQRRLLQRYNTTMFMVLLSLSDNESKSALSLESTMNKLNAIVRANTRNGDTICRYSSTQYILLMPATTYDTAGMAMERIKQLFYEQCMDTAITLSYKLRPLDISKEY